VPGIPLYLFDGTAVDFMILLRIHCIRYVRWIFKFAKVDILALTQHNSVRHKAKYWLRNFTSKSYCIKTSLFYFMSRCPIGQYTIFSGAIILKLLYINELVLFLSQGRKFFKIARVFAHFVECRLGVFDQFIRTVQIEKGGI
jgi:hypothetical protein